MIGTEIVESSSESIMIQVLTRLPELSFDVALRRMHLMTFNMHREAIDALGKMDKEAAEEVIKMDDEVDRFSLYMLRNLSQAVQNGEILLEIGLKKPSDCLGYRTVIRCIERIADHSVLIAKRIKFLQSPIDKKILQSITQLSNDSLNIFENSIVALTKNDYALAEKVADQAAKDVQNEKEFMSNLKESTNSSVIKFVLEDIRRTIEYSTDIAEVVINENIRSVISEK
jgi:phosphate uptake regulator